MGRPHPREEALLGSDRRPLGQWGWRLDQRRIWEQIRSQSCSPWISKDWGWAPRLPIASVWVSNPPQIRRMPDPGGAQEHLLQPPQLRTQAPEKGRDLSRVIANQSGAGTKLGISTPNATLTLGPRIALCPSVWVPVCTWVSLGRRLLALSHTHKLSTG